ncbi:MAG TPA: nucleotide disphospho-sugar-binding domain-containing protein [Polyangia bacterium]|nr:nucleotide disphospho-sugar-binding domain-containing protein [Polyangia bacterium]
MRRRILFVAEAVSLAQVVRLVTLARALDPLRYEVHFASAQFDALIFAGTTFHRHTIHSLPAAVVEARVAAGRRPYSVRTLSRYVDEERALLQAVRPALVVGDLRLSLSISTAVQGVPYASLINAYWSGHAVRDGFPLPDHPIVRLLGVARAARYFPSALPWVFEYFARPVNTLRRRHGLPPIGDIADVLTHGDHTLFPDVPALVPTRALPTHQHFLGPVLWSPAVPLPAWWRALDPGRPTIYVTLGSSGCVSRLPLVIDVAAQLGFQVLVATAGRCQLGSLPAHVFAADYLPGHLAARRSVAVVSNGGSSTGYQALAEGRPVLGIAFNLDQYLAMTAIAGAGAGLLLRAGNLQRATLGEALQRLVGDSRFTAAATRLATEFGDWNAATNFAALVEGATEHAPCRD